MKQIIKIDKNNNTKIEYIGYMEMLDKICRLMDKVSHENKMVLIDKYIEVLKQVNDMRDKE